MSEGVRLIRPDRAQLRWDTVDLDSQLPPEHRARVVWAFVEGLDLSAFHDRIKARDDQPGRPAADPAVLLGLWLYATTEGVGSARALERLCQQHAAYRWLCGGVPVNHNLLSEFRRDSGQLLDALLTRSLSSLIEEGLLTLEEAAIDGTKVRSRAGRRSMAQQDRLTRIEAVVAEKVAKLRDEVDADASGGERQRRKRALQAAEQQAARIKRAQERLIEREKEKAKRAETHANEEAAKGAPMVSISDPEVRLMRMADGAVRPAWNVQVATAKGFVVTIDPTDRRNDSGLAKQLVEQISKRCGRAPARLLADANAITREEIASLPQDYQDLEVYSPLPKPAGNLTAGSERNRRSRQRHEPQELKHWRERMASDAGKEVYRRRKLTEHAHAKMKNRGFGRMLVDGIAKVRAVCFLHALTHNLLQAHAMRHGAV